MDEIVGTDLSDPDFEDEMLDVLEGPSEKQLQLIGNEDTSLEDDLAQLELDGLEDEGTLLML